MYEGLSGISTGAVAKPIPQYFETDQNGSIHRMREHTVIELKEPELVIDDPIKDILRK